MKAEEPIARRYEPNKKHKEPKGFGSLCPSELTAENAQALLDRAVCAPGNEDELWVVSGKWCFCARPTRLEEQIWHGYPEIGGMVPHKVLNELENGGMIDRRQRRKLVKQKSLPKDWP